jgi:hypothetical protein
MATMAIAMGMHVRVGIEDTLFGPNGQRMSSVQQIEHVVKQARLLNRDVANGKEARQIYQIGKFYKSTEETLQKLGYAPNRPVGGRGIPMRQAA